MRARKPRRRGRLPLYPWRVVLGHEKRGSVTLYRAECGHLVARLNGANPYRHPRKVRCERCGKARRGVG